jgi:hypothetical protein
VLASVAARHASKDSRGQATRCALIRTGFGKLPSRILRHNVAEENEVSFITSALLNSAKGASFSSSVISLRITVLLCDREKFDA